MSLCPTVLLSVSLCSPVCLSHLCHAAIDEGEQAPAEDYQGMDESLDPNNAFLNAMDIYNRVISMRKVEPVWKGEAISTPYHHPSAHTGVHVIQL